MRLLSPGGVLRVSMWVLRVCVCRVCAGVLRVCVGAACVWVSQPLRCSPRPRQTQASGEQSLPLSLVQVARVPGHPALEDPCP